MWGICNSRLFCKLLLLVLRGWKLRLVLGSAWGLGNESVSSIPTLRIAWLLLTFWACLNPPPAKPYGLNFVLIAWKYVMLLSSPITPSVSDNTPSALDNVYRTHVALFWRCVCRPCFWIENLFVEETGNVYAIIECLQLVRGKRNFNYFGMNK